jgi:Zn-dependent protease
VLDPQSLLPAFITITIFLLVAFPVHEFAHAAVAFAQGDATAKLFGRLTLNPIVHLDRVGAIVMVVSVLFTGFMVGWARPTPVNTANLRDRRNGEVFVALAGPASNLAMAAVGGLVFRLLETAGIDMRGSMAGDVVYMFVLYNVMLTIFNLIPVPPLDGSTLLYRFLSPQQAWQLRPILAQYGIFIVLAVVLVLSRPLGQAFYGVTNVLVGA